MPGQRVEKFTVSLRQDHSSPAEGLRHQTTSRRHLIEAAGKPTISGSAAAAFHGELSRWNPEELFIAALSQCHILSYLFVAAREHIEVLDYSCEATGVLEWEPSGAGQITTVTLRPAIRTRPDQAERALALHEQAHELCFIARSVSCEVAVKPELMA